MRLKKMAKLSEGELAAIYAALAMNIREYSQVVEVCLFFPQESYEGADVMIALDVLASIYWWCCSYRQWVVASTSRYQGGCFDDITHHGSVSRESTDI